MSSLAANLGHKLAQTTGLVDADTSTTASVARALRAYADELDKLTPKVES